MTLLAETATRLWLSGRQLAAAQGSRDHIPAAFRDRIAPEDQRRAADYTVARVRLGRVSTLFEAAVKVLFTVGGGLAFIEAIVGRLALHEPWNGALVMLAAFACLQVLDLPFEVYRTFGIEARFGFNRTTPKLYLVDLFKQWALGLALGTPVLLVILALMQRAGAQWWLWAWLAWLGFLLLVTWAAPRFIAPLFNRFSPLGDEVLKARLEVLLQRVGFAAGGGLYVMDASRRSSHGNAYFTGIGRNKRIVLFDTLLSHIEHEEIEAVLAHELGHFKLHHIRQQLLIGIVGAFLGFALLAWLAAQPGFYPAFGVTAPSSAMALLLFVIVVPVFTYFLTPIRSWWSRRHEFEADQFAATHADAAKLGSALVKLYRDNASILTPDQLHSAFYDSHPPALARIARLRALTTAPHAGPA
jgi:STE24 endopeptidase